MRAAELVTATEIRDAHRRIGAHVLRTPLLRFDAGVLLKPESLQPSGAFKLRGAFNAMLQLDEHARQRGVVAHSSGNHAMAVARAGAELGIPTTVVMPEDAPTLKIEHTRASGARVEIVGPASAERAERAAHLAVTEGLHPVVPFDSREVLAATATIAVEILEDLARSGRGAEPVEIYVPISGGGLAGGVAAGAKLTVPSGVVRVIGVEPEVAADALASWRAGEPVTLPGEQMARTIADGLRVQRVGELPWPHLQAFLDGIVTVTEDEIRAAMRDLAVRARLVAEPSGAVPVAAALAAAAGDRGDAPRRVAVVTGGNVDLRTYAGILAA